MKVCYFIQAHKAPDQIYRLVRTIKKSSPNAQVLIGYDFTNSSLEITPLQDISDVHLLRGEFPVRRGEFSALQPYLNAINWLFNHNIHFDWLAYISGQDYPVRPLLEVEEELANTKYDGFLQYYDVLSENSHWSINEGRNRYFYQYYRLPSWTKKLIKKSSRIIRLTSLQISLTYGVHLGIPARKTYFNEKFRCYGGNHRHLLSRKCVQFLKNYIDTHPKLVHYYQKTLLPEESFIQTILVNPNQFKFRNANKIYENYSGGVGGHPQTLTFNDYPKMTNGNFFFARKFENDLELLNAVDEFIFKNKVTSK